MKRVVDDIDAFENKIFFENLICFDCIDAIFNQLANMFSTTHFHDYYNFLVIAPEHLNFFN